ncbi:MAG: gluconate 2-dehydrogenase subunit 3 family protein [Bryobacteraceae bacterium]|jgi:gluconate 2-dehydrogenase gamma chain
MTRRTAASAILQAAAVVGGQEFFSDWLRAAQPPNHGSHARGSHAPPEPNAERWMFYTPKFFSAEDLRNLDAFTSILIPTDETPGAREAHVTAFIDFVVNAAKQYAPEMQKDWRTAMGWLRARHFAELPEEQQLSLVQRISQPEHDPSNRQEGFSVYRLIKEMTVHAFYTSRMGLVDELEYKGLAYLTEFPGCTHPEHHTI